MFVCLWSSFFSPANKNLDSPFNFKLCQWVRSLGWEDSLEEGMATHCSTLTWRIQRTEKPSIGSQRVRQDWSHLACIHTVFGNEIIKPPLWTVYCAFSLGWGRLEGKLQYDAFRTFQLTTAPYIKCILTLLYILCIYWTNGSQFYNIWSLFSR